MDTTDALLNLSFSFAGERVSSAALQLRFFPHWPEAVRRPKPWPNIPAVRYGELPCCSMLWRGSGW